MKQIELDYKGSLLQQFPDWQDVVRASVYDCGKVFKNVAADLDMSASQLSRRLAENDTDTMKFQLYRLDDLLTATGDLRPVYWLVEKYCEDLAAKKKQAMNDLVGMMPKLHEILKQVQSTQ